ncbi:hypothetical protein LTR37_007351 [Vermiconidia calcicola]|uniref:Uncharacterized protein n=1 Tax=Vermiconidia calcicola TaxID=1690605 RepID=A0ACC3NDP8_9PEZI|nr:hypothetical protein LTR37_007351 [Vermiconidia calcicola]
MPRRQVYGKRSRAIYDPFAAFASPQRMPGSDLQEVQIPNLTEELSRFGFADGESNRDYTSRRRALGERSVNSVVQMRVSVPKERKSRLRAKPKIVVDDEEDTIQKTLESKSCGNHGVKLGATSQGVGQKESDQGSGGNGVDNVPLFVDGHGYNTEDDDHHVGSLLTPMRNISTPAGQETTQYITVPDTPSIAILPGTPPPPDEYSEHCASLLELSSHSMTMFSEWSNQLSSHFSIVKIAEASFGEVYRLSLLEQIAGFSSSDESVFKVIALKPPERALPKDKRKRDATLKKAEHMSKPEDVASEVKLLQRMSIVPGYTNFRDARVVKGRPPPAFAKAFREWNAGQRARRKDLSHFPDPARQASYPDDQLWAVIEMQDAGTDLECLVESGQCSSVWSVWDVFWEVVSSLAKGEEGAEFEHRDLHLGNICVRLPSQVVSDIDTKRKLKFSGLETTIIDYTISRAVMQDDSTAYHDLARDAGLFEGDSTEEYQYDIYRYMRGAVLADNPYAEFSEPVPDKQQAWDQYHPITNLIWLHYVLYKLLEQLDWPSASKPPPRKQKAQHTEWKRANDLEHVLLRVQELLDPGVVCENELRSASDLVGLAIREGWIDVEDVVGEVEEVEETNALVEQLEKLELQADMPLDEVPIEHAEAAEEPIVKPRTRRKR